MKKLFLTIFVFITLGFIAAYAHHAAEEIVDEEIYEMIDTMVADTPHADLVFDDMGDGSDGMTTITIETRSVNELERLVDDGLLTEVSRLDGDVTMEIEFSSNGGIETTIIQDE